MAENNLQSDRQVEKRFLLTDLSLRNRVSVFVLFVLTIVVGITTYLGLPKESFPEIVQKIIYIGTSYPGNSPIDIESLVTRPLEKEINTISDVDEIRSTSMQDYSTLIVEFSSTVEIEDALTRVKDAVDRAQPQFPKDLDADPNVFELDFSEFPILNINLSGNFSLDQLNEWAEYLEERIEEVDEISKVEIRGVDEKEVEIMVDPYQLEARQVSFSDIENAIAGENITLSGGNVLEGDIRRAVRIVGEFKSVEEILDVVVKFEEGDIVYLKDLADVRFGYKEKVSYARLMAHPVVMLDVIKRGGENLLSATEKIDQIIEEGKREVFPPNLSITKTNDQSTVTRDMVSSLENNIISGIILVVLVLLFFLNSRNALFVGMAIPLSMFISFMILGFLDISINMMVLFSLIMALGMLVDNGIVVVENIYRLRESGLPILKATSQGVGEVALPIITSTSTTLAAFLPLAFWPGLMGEFMKYLPITLMITLGSSLFVALVINPVIIVTYMKLDRKGSINMKVVARIVLITLVGGTILVLLKVMVLGNLLLAAGIITLLNVFVFVPTSRWFRERVLPKLVASYRRLLDFALRGWKPYLFFLGTLGLLFLSVVLMAAFSPNIVFFPTTDPTYINVFIEFPVGTDIETTNDFASEVEQNVIDLMEPYEDIVDSIVASVGAGANDPGDIGSVGQQNTPSKARITVSFVEYRLRGDVSTKAFSTKFGPE